MTVGKGKRRRDPEKYPIRPTVKTITAITSPLRPAGFGVDERFFAGSAWEIGDLDAISGKSVSSNVFPGHSEQIRRRRLRVNTYPTILKRIEAMRRVTTRKM